MTNYSLYAPRPTAIQYLAWEFGIKAANTMIARMPKDERGWVDLADSSGLQVWNPRVRRYGVFTRRQAESAKCKVAQVVAFQEGRLGKSLTGGLVSVVARG